MGNDIYILGIGRNSINIIELALDCGFNIKGLIHYNKERNNEIVKGFPIIGSFDEIMTSDFIRNKSFALSMGDLRIKKDLFYKIISLGGKIPTLIHPTCYISRYSKISSGVQILPHSIVEGDTIIEENTSITVNTVIAHNVEVGAHNLISGNVMVGAYCNIGALTHIGQGSVIVSGKVSSIGNNCILGAGSVLLTDMPKNSIYVGNPARFLKYKASL